MLAGMTATDLYSPLYQAEDGKRALDRVLAVCAQEAACHAAFPEIANEHMAYCAGWASTAGERRWRVHSITGRWK